MAVPAHQRGAPSSLLSGFDVGTLLLSISELDETWDGTNEPGTAVTRVSTRHTHSSLSGFNAGVLLLSISELDETWDGKDEPGTAVTRVSTRRTHSLFAGFDVGTLVLSIANPISFELARMNHAQPFPLIRAATETNLFGF
ncbi:hypothetical protein [Thiothrix nivea]|uniref:Uncharacterized protein n=1 Tax=Thiothrix nivea (strain ATCC 35100 / DSM 5205 / JP2) TaxID=870187 RepID=A0A656HKZ7_THINJ|nr:hypothetical protein [Thiothrix nivea]EIJ36963.1 hypothetical protein Thini_4489 [Thiothrix nivea DSM 5205]